MTIPKDIFKGYDIRGRYPSELDEEAARKIGQAFATLLRQGFGGRGPIVIARDMRKSSPDLKTALISGLFSQGATVWDIGEVSIDVFYYALGTFDAPGIMVTASHNPKEWNGFKLYQKNLEGLDPFRLRAVVEKSFDEIGGGKLEVRDVLPDYVENVRGFFRLDGARRVKVVIDAGNGMMGKIAPLVLETLRSTQGDVLIDVVPLYFEPDGNFPHHVPNPIEEKNLRDLQAKVKEVNADLGIAFDADGDRAVFLDEAGTPIRTSVIAALLASVMLRATPPGRGSREAIVYNAPSSRIVKETIESSGGRAVAAKVGHTHMKQAMQKAGAIFGAEHSGHYYFKDFFYADSGMAAALVVLDILSHSPHSISHLASPFKKYKAIAEENFPVKDFSKIKKQLREEFAQGKVSELDGLTVEYPDWWFNVRKSETEPLVRLNIEAAESALLEEKYQEIKEILHSLP